MSEYHKPATTQSARSIGGMLGYAQEQDDAVRRRGVWA